MPAYFIARGDVSDFTKLKEYQRGVISSAPKFGGKILAAGTAVQAEGETPRNFNVVLEFPNMEEAQNWYQSDEYQSVISIRQENTENSAAMFLLGLPS